MLRALIEIREELEIPFQAHPRAVRGAEPDHRKGGFLRLGLRTDELERFRNDDFRGIARELLELPLPAHDRILVEEIGDREPLVESESARAVGVFLQDGNSRPTQSVEVPLPKMSGGIARPSERYRQGLLLLAQGKTVALHSGPVVRPPGQDRRPGWRTHRTSRIEPVEAQPARRHRIEVRGLENGVVVIPGLSPTHVVRHDEDDVRFLRVAGDERDEQEKGWKEDPHELIRLGEASHHASPGVATHHDPQELRRISPDMEPVRPVTF